VRKLPAGGGDAQRTLGGSGGKQGGWILVIQDGANVLRGDAKEKEVTTEPPPLP